MKCQDSVGDREDESNSNGNEIQLAVLGISVTHWTQVAQER